MADPYRYRVPATERSFEFKEQASRFRAVLAPCPDPEGATVHLTSLRKRHHDAAHHCWAYRCGWGEGLAERCSDDGEPSGTAGQPILRSLQDAGVSDASLVVVRWFGGVKLGTGGLTRAFRTAARGVLEEAPLAERVLTATLACDIPYGAQGSFRRLAERAGARLGAESFAESWSVEAVVPLDALPEFEGRLVELREAWKGAVRWKSK